MLPCGFTSAPASHRDFNPTSMSNPTQFPLRVIEPALIWIQCQSSSPPVQTLQKSDSDTLRSHGLHRNTQYRIKCTSVSFVPNVWQSLFQHCFSHNEAGPAMTPAVCQPLPDIHQHRRLITQQHTAVHYALQHCHSSRSHTHWILWISTAKTAAAQKHLQVCWNHELFGLGWRYLLPQCLCKRYYPVKNAIFIEK